MLHTEHRQRFHVKVESKGFELPDDELSRIQDQIGEVAEAIGSLPATLELTVHYHPDSDRYHAETSLHLPRRGLFTDHWDQYLDSALVACLGKLVLQIGEYKREPDRTDDMIAELKSELTDQIVAPQDPDEGPLADAARTEDYRAFRELLSGYQDWLRLRIGRWIQRYPEIEARLGERFNMNDLVEEVCVNAFERYDERPKNSSLSEWLEDLIDPSVRRFVAPPR